MFDNRLSVEKVLNGRYPCTKEMCLIVDSIFKEWNDKLGFENFSG